MKLFCRTLAVILVIALSAFAFAEGSDELEELKARNEELEQLVAELQAELAALKGVEESSDEAESEPAESETDAEPEPEYPILEQGSKGEAVKALQQRLKDLNYLSGSVDGSFGKGTASAVKAFQQEAGLTANGIADEATQLALFADDAPKSKVYAKLNYKAIARDPDAHDGDLITFSGKILQVMESGSYIVFRIASRGNWDDVVYCTYRAPEGYSRILEDDRVTVYGTCTGIYTYETIMGGSVTIPSCTIDRIELR